MFSNFRRSPVAQKVQQVANPVRLPKARDSPWAGTSGAANVSVDTAFDTFGADADADANGDEFLFVADAADPEAALAGGRGGARGVGAAGRARAGEG